ncbi:MAG: DUF4276 family protein [Armatimonadetes bacterium]|nr:DUF4276 family protein [Armatimonadota bacterium]
MTRRYSVDLFVEDRAHEELLVPLLMRIAAEHGVSISCRVRTGRGGHGRVLHELREYQNTVERHPAYFSRPDLLVVGIDGNCTAFSRARTAAREMIRPAFVDRLVVACPDPHVERWYLADPDTVKKVVGHRPSLPRRKCGRDVYKRLLAEAVRRGGYLPTLGGIEFARELAEAMDFYRAGRTDRSFKAFLDELRRAMTMLRDISR